MGGIVNFRGATRQVFLTMNVINGGTNYTYDAKETTTSGEP